MKTRFSARRPLTYDLDLQTHQRDGENTSLYQTLGWYIKRFNRENGIGIKAAATTLHSTGLDKYLWDTHLKTNTESARVCQHQIVLSDHKMCNLD